jgi:hypothetical protein
MRLHQIGSKYDVGCITKSKLLRAIQEFVKGKKPLQKTWIDYIPNYECENSDSLELNCRFFSDANISFMQNRH